MKISVIIPVYNTPKPFLDKCIYSITEQKYRNIEILLIDDGSDKACASLCEKYGNEDCRINVFHIENEGVSKARNYGIEQSKGNWIMFTDSDDWFEKDAFDIIARNIDDNIDMLIFDSYRDIDGEKVHNHYFQAKSDFENKDIEKLQIQALWKYAEAGYYPPFNTVGTPWGKVIKASVIKDNGLLFPLGMRIKEDMVFIIRTLQKCSRVKYIQDELYNYRIHSESVVSLKKTNKEEYEICKRESAEVKLFNEEFDKQGIFSDIYNIYILNEALALKKIYSDNHKVFNEILNKEPYLSALINANQEYMNSRLRLKYKLLKNKNFFMLSILEAIINELQIIKKVVMKGNRK